MISRTRQLQRQAWWHATRQGLWTEAPAALRDGMIRPGGRVGTPLATSTRFGNLRLKMMDVFLGCPEHCGKFHVTQLMKYQQECFLCIASIIQNRPRLQMICPTGTMPWGPSLPLYACTFNNMQQHARLMMVEGGYWEIYGNLQ